MRIVKGTLERRRSVKERLSRGEQDQTWVGTYPDLAVHGDGPGWVHSGSIGRQGEADSATKGASACTNGLPTCVRSPRASRRNPRAARNPIKSLNRHCPLYNSMKLTAEITATALLRACSPPRSTSIS